MQVGFKNVGLQHRAGGSAATPRDMVGRARLSVPQAKVMTLQYTNDVTKMGGKKKVRSKLAFLRGYCLTRHS